MNMEKAIYYYNLAAEQESPMAQFKLVLIYLYGEGVPVDYEKALHYFKLSAEGGKVESFRLIAAIYEDGLGVPKSDENFKVAADKGIKRLNIM